MNNKIVRNIIIVWLTLTVIIGGIALVNWLSTPDPTDDDTDTTTTDSSYSSSQLNELLDQERPAIHQAMTDYDNLIAEYDIIEEALYLHGEWYGAVLRFPDVIGGPRTDDYHIILHKTNGIWQVAASPEIVFNYANNPNIPKSVIDNVNRK